MRRITKIDTISSAKMIGAMSGLVGLACGIMYGIGGAMYDFVHTEINTGTLLALGALVVMPAIGVVLGFAVGWMMALIYNAVARWDGGLKVDIEE